MEATVSRFRINLVAVAALRRVEPAITSGPTRGAIRISTRERRGELRLQATKTVRAPLFFASRRAAATKGVIPLAEIPTTTSPFRTRFLIFFRPSLARSSAPSCDRNTACFPPAMIDCTSWGEVLKVGGHSAASSTPSRPLVPAPTKKSLPPFLREGTMIRTARPMAGLTFRTA